MSGFLGGLDAFTVFGVAKPGQLENSFKSVWQLILQANNSDLHKPNGQERASYLSALESAVKEKINKTPKTSSRNTHGIFSW
jgi:hypothetical protein